MLNTTTRVDTSTQIPSHIAKAQVLSFLHNHEKVLNLNPLMKSFKPLPTTSSIAFYKSVPKAHQPPDPASCSAFAVVESTGDQDEPEAGSWRGGWAKRFVPETINYETAVQTTESGIVSITHAPMGVNSVTTWALVEEESGGLRVDMWGEVESNRMLMAFIRTTLPESYNKLVARLLVNLQKDLESPNGEEKVENTEGVNTAEVQKV